MALIEARGLSREDVMTLRPSLMLDLPSTHTKVSVTKPVTGTTECLSAQVKFVLPPSVQLIKAIKIALTEGSTWIKLKNEKAVEGSQEVTIADLNVRLITGESHIWATVSSALKLGGSVGSIQGDLVIGNDFSVTMVDGQVALNLSPKDGGFMQGKVTVSNGDIKVGLVREERGIENVLNSENNGRAAPNNHFIFQLVYSQNHTKACSN